MLPLWSALVTTSYWRSARHGISASVRARISRS
jgi:hypothetical protein